MLKKILKESLRIFSLLIILISQYLLIPLRLSCDILNDAIVEKKSSFLCFFYLN